MGICLFTNYVKKIEDAMFCISLANQCPFGKVCRFCNEAGTFLHFFSGPSLCCIEVKSNTSSDADCKYYSVMW